MKMRNKLIVFMALLLKLAAQGQVTNHFSFDINDYQISIVNGKVAILCSDNNYVYAGGSDSPRFPYIQYKYTLSPTTSDITYQVNYDDSLVLSNVQIEANPAIVTTNSDTIEYYPYALEDVLSPVWNEGVVANRDSRYQYLKITPFLYKNGSLYFVRNIEVTITDNSTGIYYFPPQQQNNITEQIDYLIITNSTLAQSFDSLMEWKELKGYNTKLICTDTIYNQYTGNDQQEKIKRCIYDYYVNHATKWVLLGGDNTIVPVRYCNISETLPSDLYYAAFNGNFNWDENGNQLYGEYSDNASLIPYVYLSRLPVRTTSQVIAYTQKLLKYERDVVDHDAAGRLLLTGYVRPAYGYSSAKAYSDTLYNQYIAPFWGGNKYSLYENECFLPDSTQYNANSTNIYREINRGYNLIHECSHGDYNKWALNTGDTYNTQMAASQTNEFPSIIITNACHTNAFDKEISLSESLIRNQNGGAIAYFGSSRTGYGGIANGKLNYSFQINGFFFRNLFSGLPVDAPYSYAAVAAQAKMDAVEEANGNNPYLWLEYSINPVGDPEFQIFTDTPRSFDAPVNGTTPIWFASGTGAFTNDFICSFDSCKIVVRYHDGTKIVTNNVHRVVFNKTGLCDIAVFKHNYIPKIIRNYRVKRAGSLDVPIHMRAMSIGQNKIKVYLTNDDSGNFEVMPNNCSWLIRASNMMTGETEVTETVTTSSYEVDATDWGKGIYVITGVVDGKLYSEKVVIK